ncbi:MAG: CoA transferase [Deltaproteobacteria bacterium]|nr:CoA transferase [Deltaproteobacteria bacterium]
MDNKDMDKPDKKQMPLEGIRVVEYGVFHAGPGAGAILGDLGAEVIKVEEEKGDPERTWRHVVGVDFKMPNGESFMAQISNRNKKGICLDIKKDKGRQIFDSLIKRADVFITNLRKSTGKKLRIDYDSISDINPDIIYSNVSGYGPDGPDSDLGAFDPLGQARSGMMLIAGNEEPTLLNLAILDQVAAIANSHAIITALLFRERHGTGQKVEISLLSTAIWIQYINMMMYGCLSINQISSNRYKSSPLRNCFRCKDGYWIMGAHHDETSWEILCEAIGIPSLTDDPRFTESDGRRKNARELIEIFDQAFASKTRNEWMNLLLARGLKFAPVQDISEVFKDPQVLLNDYLVDFDYPSLGKVKIPGYPVHFSAARAGTRSAAPGIGEHTDTVMREMGFTRQEIKKLKKEGIIH